MVTENQVRKVARDCSLVFNALGDPNRQDILIMLETEGPLNVLQITERLNLARPTISHHLKILPAYADGLVGMKKEAAASCAAKLGWQYRIGQEDNQMFALTKDYRLDRITVSIKKGLITQSLVG